MRQTIEQKIKKSWEKRFQQPLAQNDLKILLQKKGQEYLYLTQNQDNSISFKSIPLSRFQNSYTHKKPSSPNTDLKDLPPNILRRFVGLSQDYNPPSYLFDELQHPNLDKAIQKLRKQHAEILPSIKNQQPTRASMMIDDDLLHGLIYVTNLFNPMDNDAPLCHEPNMRWYDWTFFRQYEYLVNHPFSKRIAFSDYYERYFFMFWKEGTIVIVSIVYESTADPEKDIQNIKNQIHHIINAKNEQSKNRLLNRLGIYSVENASFYF